jgi:hypothetical protein
MQGARNCPRCDRPVLQDSDNDYIRVLFWGGTVVMRWRCFVVLTKDHEAKRQVVDG